MSENTTDEPTDRYKPPFATEGDDPVDLEARSCTVYGCETCENVVLTLYDCGGGMACHDEQMAPITESNLDINPPRLREVLPNAFGLLKTGLDICLCVIDQGSLTPDKVAAQLGYDESTVRRYLNQLVEIGLLVKTQLNREAGGFVNVYRPIEVTEMRRESLLGFYLWAGEAASLIEEASITKQEYLDESNDESINDVFWESFRDTPGNDR